MGTLLNRRRYMGGGGEEPLPQGAVRVEYIESTGTQYINTGIKANESTYLKATISNYFSSTSNGKPAFGWYTYRATNNFYLTIARSYLTLVASDKSINMGSAGIYSPKSTIEISSGIIKIGGSTFNYEPAAFVSNDIYLFGIQNARTPCRFGDVYIDNGVDIIDYIPCRIGQDGYMYDKVSGLFVGSASADAFVPGPDI